VPQLETLELPMIFGGINDERFYRLLRNLRSAPNHHRHINALEACLKQVWALVPEGDEDLFFDNIQAAERQARLWVEKDKPAHWAKSNDQIRS
jgi:hypothetical protein